MVLTILDPDKFQEVGEKWVPWIRHIEGETHHDTDFILTYARIEEDWDWYTDLMSLGIRFATEKNIQIPQEFIDDAKTFLSDGEELEAPNQEVLRILLNQIGAI